MKPLLKVGDTVMWRHGWGSYAPQKAVIQTITLVENSLLEGTDVPAVQWDSIENRDVVVTLENRHWAYGYQISPVSTVEAAPQAVPA
jgi:hypothetical protein